jgi:septal ring factor EnvC (AmiA/AmiB activator)
MTDDRYTELVKTAYEAQQAREGEAYQSLTAQLARIDTDLEALKAEREKTISGLESMDMAVEDARDALDAYFSEDEQEPAPNVEAAAVIENRDYTRYFNGNHPTLSADDDEFSTPRAGGALSD